MERWLAICIFCFFMCGQLHAQPDGDFELSVCLVDSSGSPLRNGSIQILNPQTNLVLQHEFITDTNCVKLKTGKTPLDTLVIRCFVTGFHTKTIRLARNEMDTTQSVTIAMLPLSATLPDAEVVAPPVWVRGDTTFYRIEAFKQGNERKLRELIDKLPDFSFSPEGRLQFKNQTVDKITIGGEEIFSEKLELLLNSFPVHVLDQVQAIENQTDNPVLRGFRNENKVFVNLALKKEKLRAAFGDGEMGIGTEKKYILNPVVFALYDKLKFGFIANYNNTGHGSGTLLQQEINRRITQALQPWQMRLHQIAINNFENNRYWNNRLFDNRLQINIPTSSANSIKNELTFYTDRSPQQATYERNFLNQDQLQHYKQLNDGVAKPFYFDLKTGYDIKNAELSLTKITLNLRMDRSRFNHYSIYDYGIHNMDTVQENLNNKFDAGMVTIDHSKRIKEGLARQHLLTMEYYSGNQLGAANATDIGAPYLLENGYNQLSHLRDFKLFKAEARSNWLVKNARRTKTHGIIIQYENTRFTNQMGFSKEDLASGYFGFEPLSFQAGHASTRAGYNFQHAERVGRFLVRSESRVGASQIKFPDQKQRTHSTLKPWIEFFTKWEYKFGGLRGALQLRHTNDNRPLERTRNYVFSSSIQNFLLYPNPQVGISETQLAGNGSFKLAHRLNLSLRASLTRNWNSSVYYSQFNRFVNFNTDSAIQKTSGRTELGFTLNYNDLPKQFQISLINGLSLMQRWYLFKNAVYRGQSNFGVSALMIQKSKKGRYRIEGFARMLGQGNKLPEEMGDLFTPWVFQANTKLKYEHNLLKQFRLGLTYESFHANFNTPHAANFQFLDLMVGMNPLKSKFSYSLNLNNLFNTKTYFDLRNTETMQSYYQVRLVPRHVMMRATFLF